MTGPGPGKLPLSNVKVIIRDKTSKISLLENCHVYIHVKGYSYAKVTHLDIEHEKLNNIIPPGGGFFLDIHGIDGGIKIKLNNGGYILVFHKLLNHVLKKGEKTRTWVGGKLGGIYIGFKKDQILKLEQIARNVFNFPV